MENTGRLVTGPESPCQCLVAAWSEHLTVTSELHLNAGRDGKIGQVGRSNVHEHIDFGP